MISVRNGASGSGNPPYNQISTPGSLAAGAQHLVAVRVGVEGSGSKMTRFIDHYLRAGNTHPTGHFRATSGSALTAGASSGPFTLGHVPNSPGTWVPFRGWVWETRVYRGHLTDAEVDAVIAEMGRTYSRSILALEPAVEITGRGEHRGFPGHAFIQAGPRAGEHVVLYRRSVAGHNGGDGTLGVVTSADNYAAEGELAPGGQVLGSGIAYDVRDPVGLTALADGSLVCPLSVRQRNAPSYDGATGAGYVREGILMRLPPGGDPRDPTAWQKTVWTAAQTRWAYGNSVPAERLSDGRLFLTSYGQDVNGDYVIACYRSDDGGATITYAGEIYRGATFYNECAVVWDWDGGVGGGVGEGHQSFAAGRLLAIYRAESARDHVLKASSDGGVTWGGQTTHHADYYGHPTYRLLRDGLLIGLERQASTRVAHLVYSWSNPAEVTKETGQRHVPEDGEYMVYGGVAVAPDGRVVLVGAEQLGEALAYVWLMELGRAGATPVKLGTVPAGVSTVTAPQQRGSYELSAVGAAETVRADLTVS